MSVDREWAGELEIIATSILYNVNINVTTERLDSNNNIIPNIMYTPNNIYFKQMSENIIIDNQNFKDPMKIYLAEDYLTECGYEKKNIKIRR